MEILKYVIIYIVFFLVVYLLYYLFVTNGQIKSIRGKSKKKKEEKKRGKWLKNYIIIM